MFLDSGFDAQLVIGPAFGRTRWRRPGMTRRLRLERLRLRLRLRRGLRLQFGRFLPVEADEIDGIDIEGWEATVAHGLGDDLPRKRKQDARAFNHHDLVQLVLRDVADPKDTRIAELERKQRLGV